MKNKEEIQRLQEKRDFKQIDDLLSQELKNNPNDLEILLTLAKAKMFQNLDIQALEVLERIKIHDFKSAEMFLIKAEILAKQSKTKEAIAIIKKGLNLNPNMHKGYILLGHVYYHLGDKVNAKKNYTLAIKIEPNDPEGEINYTKILLDEGDSSQASKRLRILENQFPNNIAVQMIMGQVMLDQGAYSFAEMYFNKILEKIPNYELASLYLGITNIYNNKIKEAEKEITIYNQRNPNSKDGIAAMGLLLFNTNRAPESIRLLTLVTKDNLCPKYWKKALVEAHTHVGKFDAAIKFYKQEDGNKAKFRLAEIYELNNETQRASNIFADLLEGGNKQLELYTGLARTTLKEKKYKQSSKHAKKGLKKFPQNKELLLLKLNSLLFRDKPKKALELLDNIDYSKQQEVFQKLFRVTHGLIMNKLEKYDEAFNVFAKKQTGTIKNIGKLQEKELKTIQQTNSVIDDNHNDCVFLLGNTNTLLIEFINWLTENKVQVLTDRLLNKSRQDILNTDFNGDSYQIIDDDVIRIKRKLYFKKIKATFGLDINKQVIVDCLYTNPESAGLIKKYFPQAKILFLTRDTPDIWLSQKTLNDDQLLAEDWNEVKNQILTMGLNVTEISSDKWLDRDKETINKIENVLDIKLDSTKPKKLEYWRKSYFEKGEWKNYKKFLGQ